MRRKPRAGGRGPLHLLLEPSGGRGRDRIVPTGQSREQQGLVLSEVRDVPEDTARLRPAGLATATEMLLGPNARALLAPLAADPRLAARLVARD